MTSCVPSPVYLLQERLTCGGILELESSLRQFQLELTQSIQEARLIVTKIASPQRVAFELRRKGLWTRTHSGLHDSNLASVELNTLTPDGDEERNVGVKKRRLNAHDQPRSSPSEPIVLDDSETASEGEGTSPIVPVKNEEAGTTGKHEARPPSESVQDIVTVVGTQWIEDSSRLSSLQPYSDYEIYRGIKTRPPTNEAPSKATMKRPRTPSDPTSSPQHPMTAQEARFHRPILLARTTSEAEPKHMPLAPEWVRRQLKYSCQRITPRICPNAAFVAQLKKLKLARQLQDDEIGIRAYATKVAAIAAYPYRLSCTEEVLRLPGCNEKTASLWAEWEGSAEADAEREIREVRLLDEDPEQSCLRLFYEIWGVGAKTARDFYHERGWRDLDDVVEWGWKGLSRSQQIGVKYYDEFLEKIPRPEVEGIANTVLEAAKAVRDDRVQMAIVGGYRRGQVVSSDCDVILTHPDENQTIDLVEDVVLRLEDQGYITHTLTLSTHNSKMNQIAKPLPAQNIPRITLKEGYSKAGKSGPQRHSFDTLDKGLVVWQEPDWPGREEAVKRGVEHGEMVQNPNPHRRVDIIISPWKTVGCAIIGWSGGTTFERDLRLYVEHKFRYKFDSGGVRDRHTGAFVDVEGANAEKGWGPKKTWQEAEKRVFESLELDWLEPDQRVTG